MSCRRPSLSGTACAWTPHGFYLWRYPSPCGAAGERSKFNIKPPLGAPLRIFLRGYLLKSFPQVDTSARQWWFEIRVFPLIGELPKAIEPHLPVCQLYRWQLGPNMWSSPTTKSLDPIVVTALLVDFPGKATDPPHMDLPAIVRSQRHGQRRRQGSTPHTTLIDKVHLPFSNQSSHFLPQPAFSMSSLASCSSFDLQPQNLMPFSLQHMTIPTNAVCHSRLTYKEYKTHGKQWTREVSQVSLTNRIQKGTTKDRDRFKDW